MQPFPDFDFLFADDSTLSDQSPECLSRTSTVIPSPTACDISLDLDSIPFMEDLKSFQQMAENIADPLLIYEPISPATSPAKVQRGDSIGDRSSASSEYSSPSPLSSVSSPISQYGSTSDDNVQDALAALEQKLTQPNYTSAKDNDKVKKNAKDKPEVSYIAMIAKAILSTPQQRMILGDIYKYIMDNYSYYNNQERAWRNSIRHNLSLNECFIKSGRCEGGKGNYWGIHPTCVTEFANGDFRRRQARKRVRRGMRESMISELPLSRKESIPYVQMGTHGARNDYHPYAMPYATNSNRSRYGGPPNYVVPGNTFNSPPNVNVASQMSYPSPSPMGVNNLSPIGYEASSPQSFNTLSPGASSYSNLSPSSNSGSPTSYANVSPTSFGTLKVDTSYGTNVSTSNANSNGSYGQGYSYKSPANGLLMPCNGNNDVKSNATIGYAGIYGTTSWNASGASGNFYNANLGLHGPNVNNSCAYSC